MKTALTIVATFTVWLSAGGPTEAGFFYHFSQSTYSIDAGQTVDVPVFLEETGNNPSVLATIGLTSAGVRVDFSGAGAAIASQGDIFGNPAFDIINPILGSNTATVAEFTFFNPPVLADPNGPPFEILMGTFRFTAGNQSGVTTLD